METAKMKIRDETSTKYKTTFSLKKIKINFCMFGGKISPKIFTNVDFIFLQHL